MKETKVWSAFPLCGKTYCTNVLNLDATDSDSSKYHWNYVDEERVANPEFPDNYIKHIKEAMNKYEYVFVSCHKEVRDAMAAAGIAYNLVYPERSAKDAWIDRYLKRDYNGFPLHAMQNNWDAWIDDMEKDDNALNKYVLKSNEYMVDVMRPKKRTLCIMVDVQNDFVTGALGSEWADNTTQHIQQHLKHNKWKYVDVIATRDTHRADTYLSTLEGRKLPVLHCIENSDGWQLDSRVAEYADTIVNKVTFASCNLPRIVANYHDIDEIVIFGFCTSICVVSNALLLRGMFQNTPITVFSNLCADISPEAHASALEVMTNCQIDIKLA